MGEQRLRTGGSTGVLIQSVGGGGGNGGLNITGSLAVTTNSASSTGRTAAIGIGGFGGAGGNAGKVTATVAAESGSTDRIQVQGIGDNQMAFAAQSIGGGGGAGGMNISGGISTSGQLVVGIGGFGGAGGTGGDVIANVDADLFVGGNNSIGFLAQSVGGGGGAGAINISGGIQAATSGNEPEVVFGLGGFGGAGNIAGDVTATQHGQVMAEGLFSYGVLAQSIGGGGGAGGLNVSAAVTGAASIAVAARARAKRYMGSSFMRTRRLPPDRAGRKIMSNCFGAPTKRRTTGYRHSSKSRKLSAQSYHVS
jgi:hypothetical protein